MGVKLDHIQRDVKDLGQKGNKLFYLIIGSVLFMGAFDIFRDERNYERAHPKN